MKEAEFSIVGNDCTYKIFPEDEQCFIETSEPVREYKPSTVMYKIQFQKSPTSTTENYWQVTITHEW